MLSAHSPSSSTTSSSMSSPVHEASQVHPSLHSPAVMELVDFRISRPLIQYAIDTVADTVDFALGRPSTSSRGRRLHRHDDKFNLFVNNVITRAEVTTPTLLVALVYINRIKPELNIALEEWALERVFLGALIVASKYLNDSTLKNVHWAMCTGVFGKRDVGRIEREFLDVLNFQLSVSEDDLLSHHEPLSALVFPERAQRSHHTHHSRVHHQSSSHSIPDLEPSSPNSSSVGSASPRTPDSIPTSPPVSKRMNSLPVVPKKISFPMATLDLLRSFPLPVSSSSPSHQNASQSHNTAQYPVHFMT